MRVDLKYTPVVTRTSVLFWALWMGMCGHSTVERAVIHCALRFGMDFCGHPFPCWHFPAVFFFHHTGCRLSACLTGTTGWGWSHSPLLSQTLFPAQPTSMVWHPRSCLGGWHAGIGLPVCWPSHVMWKSTPHTWLGCTFNAWCAARLVGNTSTNFPPDFLYDCPFGGMYFLNFICTVLWAFCQQAYLVFMLSVFLSLPDATSMTQLLR